MDEVKFTIAPPSCKVCVAELKKCGSITRKVIIKDRLKHVKCKSCERLKDK